MNEEGRFLVEVGIRDVRLPVSVPSRNKPGGQSTIGAVSINARVNKNVEAAWIDRFIQILHRSKREVGIDNMRSIVQECRKAFQAEFVQIEIDYPVSGSGCAFSTFQLRRRKGCLSPPKVSFRSFMTSIREATVWRCSMTTA